MNDTLKEARLHEECCSKEGNCNVSEIYLKIKKEKDTDSAKTNEFESSPLLSPSKTEESFGESTPNSQRKTSICKKTNFGSHQEDCSTDDLQINSKIKEESLGYNAHTDATCGSHFSSRSPPSVQEIIEENPQYTHFMATTAFGLIREEPRQADKRKARVPKKVYIKEEDEENMNWVEIKRERVEEDNDSDASFDPLSTCEENNLELHQRESSIMDDVAKIPERVFLKEEDCSQNENCTEIKRENFNDSDENCTEIMKESSEDSDVTSGSRSASPLPLPLHVSLDEPVSKGQKRRVSCEVCNKIFTTSNIKAHMRIHTKEKPFVCEICNKAYSQKSILKRHMQSHTKEKPYTCEICNKAFSVSVYLRTHMLTHTDEKPFICDICNKAFSRKGVLMEHKRVHTKEKRFSCNICNGTFTQKTSLSNHMEVHIEEKTLVCDLCDKAFALKASLVRHKRMHREDKTYTCEVCNKTFFDKGALKKHVQSHTKPFKCDVCNKGFSRRNLYMRHSKVHSKEAT